MPCRLLPTDRDGIPNVLVEAMAAGAPVVATNVSGIPELVEHEVNGLLVEPDDPQALADALMRLHEDPRARRAALTDNGRADRPRALRRRPPRAASSPSSSRGGAVTTLTVAPAPGASASTSTSTATARSPTPSPRGRFTLRRRDARARPRARLAERRPPRGRGVADRLGQVLLRARPRRRVPRHRRRAATSTRGSGSSRASSLQVPPDHDPSEVTARRILNWIYAWQRLPEATIGAALVESLARAGAPRARAPHARSATTARSSSTRC